MSVCGKYVVIMQVDSMHSSPIHFSMLLAAQPTRKPTDVNVREACDWEMQFLDDFTHYGDVMRLFVPSMWSLCK